MSKRIFTKEEIETLLKNKVVTKCSEKSISYDKDFKIWAVKRYQEGSSAPEIFNQAGFDINMIGHSTPSECLRRWIKVVKKKGVAGLKVDGRSTNNPKGRPKGSANLTDKEKLKRLEVEVAYLKEENRFLAKLRKESLN
jgi:transposase-like protein